MEQLILVRQRIIGFYKQFEIAINYIAKFLIGLFIFSRINTLGLYRDDFTVLFGSSTRHAFVALMSLIFTISPPSIALLLTAVAIAIQLSAVLEVAVFVFLLLALVIVFYARLAPRHSMLILAMVIGFHFNMPYAVVLFAGLYFGITSMIPVILGTAVWHFLPFFTNLAQNVEVITEMDLFEIPLQFIDVFSQIFAQLTTDFNWVILGFVFAMVVLAVHLISRIAIDHSKEIAIGSGTVIGIICMAMVIAAIETEMTFGGALVGSIFSALFVWVASFFEGVADYKRVERVKFDDDDNYYFVRIVPKITAEKGPAPAKNKAATKKKAPPAAKPVQKAKPVTASTKSKPKPNPAATPAKPDEYGYRAKLKNQAILEDEDD